MLAQAQRLYGEGKWLESDKVVGEVLLVATDAEDIAEAHRIRGWDRYYLAIKGASGEKNANLLASQTAFFEALSKTINARKRLSVFNGLPLALWQLGEKRWAWELSDQALREFPEEPSVWQTRGNLMKWEGRFEEGILVFDQVSRTADAKRDYRNAGSGQQSKGDSLVRLGRKEEARQAYQKAIVFYKMSETETSQPAKFHIESVEKKLAELKV